MKNTVIIMIIAFLACISPVLMQAQGIQTPKTKNTTKSKPMKNSNEIIVDVRTPEEYSFDGHANCSVNYPLDVLSEKIESLKSYQHIVLVCRSGARAGAAKRMLESAGIKNVDNLGPWQNVNCRN